ncbi:MAG: hypothetical protein SO082_03760 [Candidatus Limisoma sp.]|nr:hypothetical protein [Candidatus Limisoma sp.]
MDKINTPILQTEETAVKNGPRRTTIEFIKQFARAYSSNNALQLNLGGFIAN